MHISIWAPNTIQSFQKSNETIPRKLTLIYCTLQAIARGPIKSVISTMLLVMENLNLGTITTQIHFAINITNKTEFSKHIWQLQDKGINFTLKWSITDYVSKYKCGSRMCELYLMETFPATLLIWSQHWKHLCMKSV